MTHPVYPEPKLVYVFDNCEGHRSLRIQAPDGTLWTYELTLDRTLRLIGDLTRIAQIIARDSEKRPV
jgi:hypothetical protein